MTIPEFSTSIKKSLSKFLGCNVEDKIYFNDGKFIIEGFISYESRWLISNSLVIAYRLIIVIEDDCRFTISTSESPFMMKNSGLYKESISLERALEYIKEKLETPKSKAIYENL